MHGLPPQPSEDGRGQTWVYIRPESLTRNGEWHWPDEQEQLANAHLIAAAPDMATVLEYYADQLCEGFCKDLPQAGTYHPEMDLDCSGCRARAALAKARGEA